MKLLIITPIPLEYKTCREVLALRDMKRITGCRAGRTLVANNELFVVQSGPGKARAASAAMAAIDLYKPDIVIDSGSCGGIQSGSSVGQIIIGKTCFEYDITGFGFPKKSIPDMKLTAGFGFLALQERESLFRKAVEIGESEGFNIIVGIQACGEYLINSIKLRERLSSIFFAAGCNWETAGVFISSLRSSIPVMSFRIITDLGNKNALKDFRKNVKKCSKELYRYIQVLLETGWFSLFIEQWNIIKEKINDKIPGTVLP